VFTTAAPVDAVYFNITQRDAINLTVYGYARSNNVVTGTATNFTIVNNTWYAMKIYINSASLVTFTLYNDTALLWSDTAASNIPTAVGRETSNAFVAYVNGGTTALILANLDYISVGVNRTLIR
jgi:hypothetical protein